MNIALSYRNWQVSEERKAIRELETSLLFYILLIIGTAVLTVYVPLVSSYLEVMRTSPVDTINFLALGK